MSYSSQMLSFIHFSSFSLLLQEFCLYPTCNNNPTLSSCKPIQFTVIKLHIIGDYTVYSNWRFFLSCGKIPKWDVSRFGHQTLRPRFVQHFAHLPWAWDSLGTFVKHSGSKCSKPDLEIPADLNSIYLIPLFRIWVYALLFQDCMHYLTKIHWATRDANNSANHFIGK